jgi:hypothetical protein
MSDLQLIESTVDRAAQRRRWQRAWRGLWRGLLAAALVWLAALGAYKALPLPVTVLPAAAVAAGIVVLLSVLFHAWRRDTRLATARWIDHRQALKERLSTALELGRDAASGPWHALLVQDAARQLGRFDLRTLLPYRLPRASRWALLVLALGATLGFVPEYRSKAFLQKERDKEVIRETGRQLADLTRRSLEHRKPALENTREAIKSVGELGTDMMKNPLTRAEALKDLAKITDKVQQDARELTKSPALKAMERAARSSSANSPADADELKKQIDALQQSLGNKDARADALDKLQRDLQKAQQAAANLMNKDAQGVDAAKDSLAKTLSSLAKQSQEMGAALPALEEAIAALEAGKIDQLMKDLQIAEKDLERMREMAQALQQLQQQAEKLGKDLAEQLKNGQVEAAQTTLDKMVKQLQAANLTPEQLQKIMNDVAKATEQAGPYGKVGDLLKQAVSQLGKSDKPGAAKSLAEASKELENLMQQMADAQDLKASLDALKRAQFCVGNGMGWCNSPGPPRGGKGGKPGKGVGTWADDNNWMDPPENELWDNSGVERPDTDPRGHTDRGDGNVPEGLVPTKVKGRMSPGGQMPSITLKGVSIKGQSTVSFQETATAAQSEAQSAQSHDQVPRAYQGAVKDYFDDVKK